MDEIQVIGNYVRFCDFLCAGYHTAIGIGDGEGINTRRQVIDKSCCSHSHSTDFPQVTVRWRSAGSNNINRTVSIAVAGCGCTFRNGGE